MKENKITYQVAIHLVQGEPIRFTVSLTAEQFRNLGANIEKAMTARYLGLELDNRLRLLPSHNIREIEISPAPQALIANVIRASTGP
jgi:hypothetical protein